jgi:hypothetical protein
MPCRREKGEQLSTYAFDPQTGQPLREYLFPKDLGWGLACTDGNEFSFLIADSEKKTLNMVKLAPEIHRNNKPSRGDSFWERDWKS